MVTDAVETASRANRRTPAALECARALVDPFVASVIGRLDPASRLVAAYHLGWVDADGKPIDGRHGKGFRPALALLSARAARAGAVGGLPGAAAVELVHNYSILHDDVIDGDMHRRHRPTAWAVFGQPRAILAGDALMSLACEVVLESSSQNRLEALARLAHAVIELNEGQQLDVGFESRLDVSVEECLDMARAKTSALIACSASIGAVLAGAPAFVVEGLDAFGSHLGLAFQGVDDLLGIWGQPAITGKPAGNDLRQKKKSLPVAYGFASPGACRLREILSREPLADDDVEIARDLLEHVGARQWVADLVDRELDLALAALEPLPIPRDVRAELHELARFAATRQA